MSYNDERMNQMDQEINHLNNLKRQLRDREKSVMARHNNLSKATAQIPFNNIKDLRRQLGENLSPTFMPANVGGINEIAWPFWFQIDIDLGTDPVCSINNRVSNFFQVDQEAAFIAMSISTSFGTDAANLSAIKDSPFGVEFIDRQSSRRFNSGPIPIQMLGSNSNPSVLPTPMLIVPNAILAAEVYGLVTTPQATTGSGVVQFSFFGYRTRIENAEKVLSTVFGTP